MVMRLASFYVSFNFGSIYTSVARKVLVSAVIGVTYVNVCKIVINFLHFL